MPQAHGETAVDTWPSGRLEESLYPSDLINQEQGITGLNVGREISAELGLQPTSDVAGSQLDPAPGLPEFMLLAGVVMLLGVGLLCLWQVRGRIARRKKSTPPPRAQIAQIKQRHVDHADVANLQGELHTAAQKLATQMANRAKHLECLLDRADQRIAELTSQLNASSEVNLAAKGVSTDQSAPPAPQEPVLDPLSQRVYDLADTGQNALEIAQSLDEQVGKVELILALRNTQAAATGLLR